MAVVFLDIDGTLTEVASPWQDIHEYYQLWDTRGVQIANNWLQGKITYDDFCHQDVALWNELGLTLEAIHSRFDTYEIRKEAGPAIDILVDAGYKIVLLSSGFRYIGQRVLANCRRTDVTKVIANDLYVDGATEKLTVTVAVSGDRESSRSKAGHVKTHCSQWRVEQKQAIAIGDGPSDQHMFDACGASYLVSSGAELLLAVKEIVSNGYKTDNQLEMSDRKRK